MFGRFKWLRNVGMATVGLFVVTEKSQKCEFFWGKKSPATSSGAELDNTDVLMWGNAEYIPRPDWKDQFANLKPKLIKNAINEKGELMKEVPKFTQVATTATHIFGVDPQGKVWSCDHRKPPSFFDQNDPTNFITVKDQKFNRDQTLTNVQNLGLPGPAKKIGVTQLFLWALSESGDLYQYFLDSRPNKGWRKIPTVSGLSDFSAGQNHLLMLTKQGTLYAMGSDELGQCAGGEKPYLTTIPAPDAKIPNPQKVAALGDVKVKKIFSKNDQNFVVAETGEVFSFGSNSLMQQGFVKEYQSSSNPSSAVFVPRRFNPKLDEADCDLQDIAMGHEFTLFHCKNRTTGRTQVYGTGTNLYGQLAAGMTTHLNDFGLIELLSDYTIHTEKGEVPMEIKKLSCGDNHCIAQLGIDGVLIWGSNEFGQIGNRKRSVQTKPIIVTPLKNRKVRLVQADGNMTYALAEKEPPQESPKAPAKQT